MVASRRLRPLSLIALTSGLLLLTPVARSAALAQPADNRITVDRWGGATTGVTVDGDRAYVAVASSLTAVDISDPTSPRELARSQPERDLLTHLNVVDGHVLALGHTTGLTVFDVLDPVVPTAVARFGTLGAAEDLFVEGTTAYLCDLKAGLRILDMSDPRAPRLAGEWLPPDGYLAARVAVANQRAYVIAWLDDGRREPLWVMEQSRLIVLDVADPAAPRMLGELELAFEVSASDIAVKDGAVFVGLGNSDGLLAIDARDPSRMAQRGILAWVSIGTSVEIAGDILYVSAGESGTAPLMLFDVDGPDPIATLLAHTEEQLVSISRDSIGGVAVAEGRAYVATGRTLEILDIGQPFHDSTLGAVQLVPGDELSLADVAAVDGLVLVAARQHGLRIVDGSDPSAPREVATLPPVPNDRIAPAVQHVALSGRTAYLTESSLGSGVRVVDVTDPSAPVVRGVTEQPGYGGPPAVMGGYVIVPVKGGDDGDFGLRVIDVRNPAAPQAVGWLRLDHAPLSVAVAGSVAVVSGGGLVVVDLSNPRAPRRRGATDVTDRLATGLAFDGRWAYAAAGGGLLTFDVADLDQPRVTSQLLNVSGIHEIHRVGDTLYAVDGGVVTALDLTRPGEPRVRATWRRPTGNRALTHGGGTIWLVGAQGVLRALDLAAPTGMTTQGEAWFEGMVTSASIDGDRVAAVTNWQLRRPLLTVFGGAPRPKVLGQSITADVDQPLGSIVADIDVALHANHLWLTGVAPGFAAFDIAEPSAIRRLTHDAIEPFPVYGPMRFAGDRAYANVDSSDRQRIGIYDVAAPSLPRRIGALTLDWQHVDHRQWAVDGTTLWRLGHSGTGSPVDRLYALDVTDPAAPREAAAIPLSIDPLEPNLYRGLAAADGTLLLFRQTTGVVEVWDARSPSGAHVVGRLDLHAAIDHVAIADGVGWAGVYSDRARIAVLDLSDPAIPSEIASVPLADPIWGADIRAAGRSATVANHRGGLYVIRVPRPGAPPSDATPQLIGRDPGSVPTPHEVLTPPPPATPTAARPARIFLPIGTRQVRLSGPSSHIVLALDRSAAMAAPLNGRAPNGAPSTSGTRFDAARALAEAVAAAAPSAAAAAANGGPTVSVVAYDRQAERLAVGAARTASASAAIDTLRRWLDAHAPTTAAVARHDVALAAAAADIESVAPSGCAFVALVTAAGASGSAAADRDATARAAALRAAGVRTLAVTVRGNGDGEDDAGPPGDGAADRAWLADLVGAPADVRSLTAAADAAPLADTLLALAAGCTR